MGMRTAVVLLLLGLAAGVLAPASVDESALARLRRDQAINRALLAELGRALDRLEAVVEQQGRINRAVLAIRWGR